MNFDFSDDQHAIKRTAKDLLAERFKFERVRELAESGDYDDATWNELCELGWPGIFIAEEYGGQGLGAVELIILMEELGYALAPLPFLSNAAAGLVLQAAGSEEQKARWLPGIASGELRGTLGILKDGEARLVPDGDSAEVIVLCGHDDRRVVERSAAEVEPVRTMDATRRYARVRAGDAGEALDGEHLPGLSVAALALSAELTGVAQRAMEMAVEYARDRKQFGRAIGSYQAVSHRCAQMLLEVEGARSASYYGAWTADAEPESLALAGCMAKAYASDAGWRVCTSSLQVHGGIGFTWEHDLHFLLKRAKVDAILYGSAREHRDAIAEPVGGRGAGQRLVSTAASGDSTPWLSCSLGRSQWTSAWGWATTWRTVTAVRRSRRRGRSSPSQRDTPVGSVETTISSNSIGSQTSITATIGSGSPSLPLTFLSPALRIALSACASSSSDSGPLRGVSNVKRQAPRAARSFRAASNSSEVAVRLATTRTWNSQAICLLVAFATSLQRRRHPRESWAGPAHGPGSGRDARSPSRSGRAV